MHWEVDDDRPWDLLLVAGLTVLLDLVVLLFPGSPVRIVLGLPFVLFFPGYAFVALLFPERHRRYTVERGPGGGEEEEVEEGIDALERVALSLGLSIAVVPLIGLGLNYTPWGIRLTPILVSVSGFILVCLAAAAWRRAQLDPDERFRVAFVVAIRPWSERSALDKVLTVALAASILAAVGTLGYVLLNPRPGEAFTEFYVLGSEGKAAGYPRNLTPGEEATVTIGVRNHEHREVSYVVEAWLADQPREANASGNASVRSLYFLERWTKTLPSLPTRIEAGEPYEPQYERNWTFSLQRNGTWKLSFVLYGEGLGGDVPLRPDLDRGRDYAGTDLEDRWRASYRSLHLWVTVG